MRIEYMMIDSKLKLIYPSIDRKQDYLNLFNNSKKDILAQMVA